jgi:hypothetical protein
MKQLFEYYIKQVPQNTGETAPKNDYFFRWQSFNGI